MDLPAVQAALARHHLDAWLVYDFRNSNPVFARLYPYSSPQPGQPAAKRHLTRRVLLLIPRTGTPLLLHSPLDAPGLRDIDLPKRAYGGWAEFQSALAQLLAPGSRVAMEYVPGGALPVMSIVDAGTIELVRALGVEVVSSANLVQQCLATWSPAAYRQHARASTLVNAIKDEAFALIGRSLSAGQPITERQVQRYIVERFDAEGLEYPDPPIVAVNAHAGDPHFEVPAENSSPIRRGDWVLIDLWARVPGDENIYSDITWVGFVGRPAEIPARHREVFAAVKAARDAAVRLAQSAWKQQRTLQGWELDLAAREQLIAAGFEKFIRHRTGHSLSPGSMVHGLGANLDGIETRDTREIIPGLGWTVEPGLYLPDPADAGTPHPQHPHPPHGFGVRLEINMYADPEKGPVITSGVQDEIICLG
ncbi:MAG: M24 family metallopeptidase [Phycisphaerales bacterium]